jgi:hypothetical protein
MSQLEQTQMGGKPRVVNVTNSCISGGFYIARGYQPNARLNEYFPMYLTAQEGVFIGTSGFRYSHTLKYHNKAR